MSEIKPSIVKLYELLGEKLTEQQYFAPDFWVILHELERAGFSMNPSKVSSELAETLRACVHDFPFASSIQNVASFLLHQGFDFPDLIPSLSSWDQLMFKWQAEGITPEIIRKLLKSAGFDHNISLEASDKLAKLIENPANTLSQFDGVHASVASVLFGERCVCLTQNMDEYPPIAESFLELFNRAGWQNKITEIDSSWKSDEEGGRMIVHLLFLNQTYQFESDVDLKINADELMVNFDEFLTHIGRDERVFNLNIPLDYPEQIGCFVVAEPDSFARLCQTLHLPVSRTITNIKPNLQLSQQGKVMR